MTQSILIATAEKAAQNPTIINSNKSLFDAGKLWAEQNILAVDTEFIRERTYYAILGLVQVSDGETVWLVDPLEITDFQPLVEMLSNPDILKLLHAPSEDLEVLQKSIGCMPEPMFDMQLAAAYLGQALQISYQKLLEWQLGVLIDKGESRSNWLQRPLSDSQLHYAALDVSYLPMIYTQVTTELEKLGRQIWVTEDSQLQLDKARTSIDFDHLYLRFRNAWRLKPEPQKILQALCHWRELEAEKRNLPRTFILRDNDLMGIAQNMPTTVENLKACTQAHPRALQRHSRNILELVAKIRSENSDALSVPQPPLPLNTEEKDILLKARADLSVLAAQLDIETTILASKKELEYLILNRPMNQLPARFQGWRSELISGVISNINQLPRTT
ncbi:MAG: ribonuclease D [Xanthomonadales bacterium]|nr:ribonuclease D [Xanthomonadales bacterium]